MEEVTIRDWLTLAHLPLAPAALRRLVTEHRQPDVILALPDTLWRRAGAAPDAMAARRELSRGRAGTGLDRQIECARRTLEHTGACLVPLGTQGYPPLLSLIHDPPPLLYFKGLAATLLHPQFAVVGSRRCSSAGARAAAHFAGGLVAAGFSVASGLALGVDAAAHQAALSADGATVAVIATGIDLCYPKQHRVLSDDICEQGAVISEFNPGTAPRRARFPMRNRIISGMSVGVLVAEAAQRSGSLVTARLALEQNREVFALPHSIFDPGGAGCHQLIRDGAKLTEHIAHILEEVGCLSSAHMQRLPVAKSPPSPCPIWEAIGHDPTSVDELVEAGLGPPQQVLARLVELELEGYVERRAGLYQRKV